jgi:hypothetical protein
MRRRLVNELWRKWNKNSNPLPESDGQDYKHAFSLMNKQLCAEAAKAYDAEFGQHGIIRTNARRGIVRKLVVLRG